MTQENKPKRKLKDIDFSSEDSHIALVHKDQGGPANGADYRLVLKAANQTQKDIFLEKASQVKVTLSVPDFLSKLFGLWGDDAEVLSRALGFTTPQQEEIAARGESIDSWYEEYITDKVNSIEIMKSLHESKNLADTLADLTSEEYFNFVQDQAMLEKAFLKIERLNKSTDKVIKESKPAGDDTSKSEVKEGKSPVVKQKTKETKMDEIVELQKSLNEQKEMLTKALEQVKALESEKKEQVVKSKTAKISEIVKDEAHAKIIAKASLELESEEDFTAFVAAISAMQTVVDNSEMFVEKGLRVPDTESKTEVNHVEKLLKAKYAAK